MIKEKDIQKQIINYLRLKGWIVIKAPTAGIYKKNSDSWIPLGQKGISDLICCNPQGQFVAIEIKRPGNTLSVYQSIFLDQVRQANGKTIIAYSLDDVIKEAN